MADLQTRRRNGEEKGLTCGVCGCPTVPPPPWSWPWRWVWAPRGWTSRCGRPTGSWPGRTALQGHEQASARASTRHSYDQEPETPTLAVWSDRDRSVSTHWLLVVKLELITIYFPMLFLMCNPTLRQKTVCPFDITPMWCQRAAITHRGH